MQSFKHVYTYMDALDIQMLMKDSQTLIQTILGLHCANLKCRLSGVETTAGGPECSLDLLIMIVMRALFLGLDFPLEKLTVY